MVFRILALSLLVLAANDICFAQSSDFTSLLGLDLVSLEGGPDEIPFDPGIGLSVTNTVPGVAEFGAASTSPQASTAAAGMSSSSTTGPCCVPPPQMGCDQPFFPDILLNHPCFGGSGNGSSYQLNRFIATIDITIRINIRLVVFCRPLVNSPNLSGPFCCIVF